MKTPEVTFTHTDKLYFPKVGFTKGQMIRYYVDAAPYLVPHLEERPVTLIRFPDGVDGEKFYEKNAPSFAPEWIRTFSVPRRSESSRIRYIVIDDVATLAWCANIGAIELHPFLHRAPKLDRPTHVVLDLDPGEGAGLLTCARVALLIRDLLDELGLESFPKVSGSKGLQLYVPLNTPVSYASTGAFARGLAELLERRHPDLVVSGMAKVRRRERVLIDWSQNSASKTTVAVYSMRGKRDEPFVSMAVEWEELKRALGKKSADALFFTPEAAIRRLKKMGDLFAPVLTLKQKLPKAFVGQSIPAATSRAPMGRPEAPVEDSLKRYAAKRDFTRTREPSGKDGKSRSRGKPGTAGLDAGKRFVIQKHAASHLHYDFRLEMGGTLKSWAVPKGLPTEPGIKRSAFAVEDHPMAYMRFEGTIPKGQYGGGTVMVWDIGTYALLGGDYGSGNLKLDIHGRKLKGEWHMFRIRSDEGKDVWLIAKSGGAAKAITARQDDRSVLSGRSMARIARDNDAQWKSAPR